MQNTRIRSKILTLKSKIILLSGVIFISGCTSPIGIFSLVPYSDNNINTSYYSLKQPEATYQIKDIIKHSNITKANKDRVYLFIADMQYNNFISLKNLDICNAKIEYLTDKIKGYNTIVSS